ncbi:limbic system-associated membrane protein [Nilaparvata lugens]|uniref:limbic system-associated membrane protein n=1 Tax=Nilaparvata lugens TaxID=108931 RepID=UPI00193CEAAE|nr:limbic system-associated membrane protein [Nilaparvata lugens]
MATKVIRQPHLALAVIFSSVITLTVNHPGLEHGGYWEQAFAQPYFDNSTKRDVTTTIGKTAYLNCKVRNLGDRAVSWIRGRDLHILTVGGQRYTRDRRFQPLHADGSDEWTLRVVQPRAQEAGTYECQVSTEPKISQAFQLNVVVSRASISGSKELFVKRGSDFNLTCVVLESQGGTEPPLFIYWYKDGRVVNYSSRDLNDVTSESRGVTVVTDAASRSSRLHISSALPEDTGNYTCSPSSSLPDSTLVHVLNGEEPAAMQHGNSSSGSAALHIMWQDCVSCNKLNFLPLLLFCGSLPYHLKTVLALDTS